MRRVKVIQVIIHVIRSYMCKRGKIRNKVIEHVRPHVAINTSLFIEIVLFVVGNYSYFDKNVRCCKALSYVTTMRYFKTLAHNMSCVSVICEIVRTN